ncbi:MAG: CocE/NonD family hydrolase, partial [Bacteroidota bacterium]
SFKNMDSIEGRKSTIFQRWLQHPSLDRYWQNMVPYKTDFSKITIPILTITGYFDDDQVGAMYYYKEHLEYNKNASHTLLIGPYDHYGAQGYPSSEWQGYKIGPSANINIKELLFKWFDYTLKDSIRPQLLKDKVNYQVMGTNEWKHISSISKMNNDTLLFYFSNTHAGSHFKLLSKKPTEREYIRQEMDYLSRVDTTDFIDEKVLSKRMEQGEYVSFISDPFETSIIVNSTFFGEIKNIINKKDYDLNIRLYEQLPDGTYFNLSQFLGRASYVKDRSIRQLLTPGKEETIPYSNSFFTSKKLSKGSRLVVLVGVNKNKYWQVNYGTGKDVSDETILDGKIPLEIKWMNDSYIKVPIWKDK